MIGDSELLSEVLDAKAHGVPQNWLRQFYGCSLTSIRNILVVGEREGSSHIKSLAFLLKLLAGKSINIHCKFYNVFAGICNLL